MAASQKLSHLLQLADQGPALRAALADEVAELLAAWPSDYPESMRCVCEALLAKAREPQHDVGLLAAIQAARESGDVVGPLAQSLHIDLGRAEQILKDASGAALAAACKSAGIDRAAFSALALLLWPLRDRSQAFAVLDAFDKAAA
jgi:hypothetical protein